MVNRAKVFVTITLLAFFVASLQAQGPEVKVDYAETRREIQNFEERGTYPGKAVHATIRRTGFDLVDRIPWITPPALMMLCGGLLLYRAGRRTR